MILGVRGVGHAEEMGYLFDSPVSSDGSPDDPEDQITRRRLITLWTNFVKHLYVFINNMILNSYMNLIICFRNPTPEKDELLNNITWEKVAPNNLVYLNINKTLEMQINPRRYLEWEKIIDAYVIPPLINY